MTKKKFTLIDLFAGCGGLSLGLEQAGFIPIYVNELNNDALESYLINRDNQFPYLRKKLNSNDIKDVVSDEKFFEKFKSEIKKNLNLDLKDTPVDLLVGGPPCQGFSGIGIRRSYSVDKIQLPSNHLYQDMAYMIFKIQPKIFLFENVRGLLSARWTKNGIKGEIFNDVLNTFTEIPNYIIKYKLLHAKDYGVPQNRPRVILVGLNKNYFKDVNRENIDAIEGGFLPKPTNDYPNIEEILSDLVDKDFEYGGESKFYSKAPQNKWQKMFRSKNNGNSSYLNDLSEQQYSRHSETVIKRFNFMIKNNGKIPEELKTKKFAQRVLPKVWSNSGPSITTCSLPDDFVHYSQPRSITVREMARIQTFPDWYKFYGKRTTGGIRRAGNPRTSIFDREVPKYTQIGNAVPPKLAYEIGKFFKNLIFRNEIS